MYGPRINQDSYRVANCSSCMKCNYDNSQRCRFSSQCQRDLQKVLLIIIIRHMVLSVYTMMPPDWRSLSTKQQIIHPNSFQSKSRAAIPFCMGAIAYGHSRQNVTHERQVFRDSLKEKKDDMRNILTGNKYVDQHEGRYKA